MSWTDNLVKAADGVSKMICWTSCPMTINHFNKSMNSSNKTIYFHFSWHSITECVYCLILKHSHWYGRIQHPLATNIWAFFPLPIMFFQLYQWFLNLFETSVIVVVLLFLLLLTGNICKMVNYNLAYGLSKGWTWKAFLSARTWVHAAVLFMNEQLMTLLTPKTSRKLQSFHCFDTIRGNVELWIPVLAGKQKDSIIILYFRLSSYVSFRTLYSYCL